MRPLIAYPLSLMFFALSPACGEKHSLGELTDSGGDPTGSTGDPSGSTGDPPASTGDPPSSTSGTTTGEPPTTEGNDPCTQHTDQASCVAAGCEFVGGGALEVDENGCRWGDGGYGFCVGITGGNQSPALHCAPDGTPVVFAFDPLNLPADWGPCSCEEQGLAIDCYAYALDPEQTGCGVLPAHCESLTDEASCNQFQGEPGLNGCLWVQTTLQVAADPACNIAPEGRCIPVYLRQDGGCFDQQPPDWCDPVEAATNPYWGRVSDDVPPSEELELLDHVPCQFEPLGYTQCWADEDSPALCDCACLP